MIANFDPSCWLAGIAAGAMLVCPASIGMAGAQDAAPQATAAPRSGASPATPRRPAASPACRTDSMGTATVSAVHDGRSFVLDDGREVRLDGIEVPPVAAPGVSVERAAAGLAAKAALEELVLHRTVELRTAETVPDRYGRIVAQAVVLADGGGRPVADELLAHGHARMAADAACAAALLERERGARRGQAWSLGRSILFCAHGRGSGGPPGRKGSFQRRGRDDFVGPRERRHYLREFRPALVGGSHRHHRRSAARPRSRPRDWIRKDWQAATLGCAARSRSAAARGSRRPRPDRSRSPSATDA